MDIDTTGNRSRAALHHSHKALLLGCTALVTLAVTPAFAQQAETGDNETELQQVVVESKGSGNVLDTANDAKSIVATSTTGGGKIPVDILETPASVSVITAKEIQERGATSVEQVLQYTPGILTDFYGSDDRFDYFKIRGFDAHMYRDGMVVGRPFGGLREEPYAFERIEVLKGASSAGLGVADPGGSVNYVTKRPKSVRFGEAYLTGGSFSHAELGFDFGDNITADDTLSFRLTGKGKIADEEYDYSQDDEKFIMGGLTWRPTEATNLTIVFDHLDRDGVAGSGGHPSGTDFDRSVFFGEPDYNYRDINRNTLNVMFDHDFGNGLTFNANARYSKADSNFGYAYIAYTPPVGSTASRAFFGNDSEAEQFIVDAHLQYEHSFDFAESKTVLGTEYNDYQAESTASWGAAPGIDWLNPVYSGAPTLVPVYSSTLSDQKTKAVYFQQDLTFFDRLILTGGLRHDWLDIASTNRLTGVTLADDFSETSARFGATYKITEQLAAYASYSESVAPPSIGVDPETGVQYEVGLKYRPESFPALFSIAYYDLTKENITVTDPVTLQLTPVGKIRHRGIDLEAKAEVTSNISVIAAYSYIDSQIVENGTGGNEGNRLAFVPKHQASTWINYTLPGDGPRGDMTFGVGARYTDSYFYTNDNTSGTDSNIVVDAAFSYKLRETTTLQVNVSNVFDDKHIDYGGFGADWYNPGRAITATLRQTW